MAQAGQVWAPTGGSDALGCLMDCQPFTEFLDALGGVGPHCAVGVGGHRDVLQAAHGRHEPAQLRRCVDRLDFGERG